MKVVLKSIERGVLLEKAALLESKGIPAYVDDVAHAGALPSHLYVVLDRHYDDALSLLKDSDHPVSQPVSEDEMADIAEELREVKVAIGDGIANRLMIAVLVVMAVLYVGARVFG